MCETPGFSLIAKGEIPLIFKHVIAQHGFRDHGQKIHDIHGWLSFTAFESLFHIHVEDINMRPVCPLSTGNEDVLVSIVIK